MKHVYLSLVVYLWLVTGCGPSPEAIATQTATAATAIAAAWTATPTFTPTPTQTFTPTPIPTDTPTPVPPTATPTSTRAPTNTPTPVPPTTTPTQEPTATPERIKLGYWEGKITSGWPGDLSFQVESETNVSDFRIRVPVFGREQQGCETELEDNITIQPDSSFEVEVKKDDSSTSLIIDGMFDSNTVMTGSVVGVCQGQLVLLGMEFRADWLRP